MNDYNTISTDFSAMAQLYANKMAEIEYKEVEYPVCHLVTRGPYDKVAAPYFYFKFYCTHSSAV